MATVEEKQKTYFAKIIQHYDKITESIDDPNKVETNIAHFTEIIQIFIWGEKNKQIFFDFFIEQKILDYFIILADINRKNNNDKENVIKLIKFYSFFLLNLKSVDIINYVYSHANFNNFLNLNFDFEDDDIVFYFVNFVKSLSQNFNKFPFQIFYNAVG